jgi:HAD superfamily hydrolase (TIGR01509 family)
VIRGVLFDLDGVLADTERLQWAAYRQVLGAYGVDVGLEEYRLHWIRRGGGPEYARRTYHLPITVAELKGRKAAAYLALVADGVAPRAGAVEAVERLRPTHRLALATNSTRAEVDLVLGRIGLAGRLHAIVVREDYLRAKPAPDAYQTAAAALGLPAGECVVVEDTERGVQAAVAAGIRVIAAPHDLTDDNDFSACARRLGHLDELTAALLTGLA